MEIATIKGKYLPIHEKRNKEDLILHNDDGVIYISYIGGGDLCRGTWQEVGDWIDKNITDK